ncbi:MAG: hypothetical protein HY217_09350 [Candidatus Rokubacteria bacterium]|nr:hypothetical protein [Candidatus Rokubacteria bacterium]
MVHKGYVRRPGGVAPFDSSTLAPGQTFTHAFTVPGTYRYVCVMHEGSAMTGEVVVKRGRACLPRYPPDSPWSRS